MNSSMLVYIRCFIIWSVIGIYKFLTADNFTLMSGSLKTFQVHACDGEELYIKCLPPTVISINLALYGRMSEQSGLCQFQQHRTSREENITTCLASNALKVIEGRCQEQEVCRLLTLPRLFHEDPCPGFRKYAEVAYKCRPVEFVNKIACEGYPLSLSCDDSLRILIYSANFGSSQDGVAECPQTTITKNKEVCQASYATETVMSMCQGKQHCFIVANIDTFGNPGCSSSVTKFLKVLFKCVPKEVLKDTSPPDDVIETSKEVVQTTSYPAWASGMDRTTRRHMVPIPRLHPTTPGVKLEMQRDDISARYINGSNFQDRKVVELVTKVISAHKFLAKNTQKLILYLTISLGIGLILFIAIIVIHVYFANYSKSKSDLKLEVTPTCAEDFFSDSDLEHFEGTDSEDVCNTLRKISDTVPKAPITSQDSSHYFS